MACIIFLLDSIAVEWRFSDCGWCQRDRGHLVRIPRPKTCLAPLFCWLSRLQPPCCGGEGWESMDSRSSFPLRSGVSGPKKAMPRDRQGFSAWRRPHVDFAGMGCSDRVGGEKGKEKGGPRELCLVKGVWFWGSGFFWILI